MLTPAMFSAYFPSFSPTMQPTPVLLDAKQGFFYSLKDTHLSVCVFFVMEEQI